MKKRRTALQEGLPGFQANKLRLNTPLQFDIFEAAIGDCWRWNLSFTVATFCAKHGFKDTRYLRSLLHRLAAEGWLFEFKRLDVRNELRLFYCSNQADTIENFTKGEWVK